jgi:hypothetical protein
MEIPWGEIVIAALTNSVFTGTMVIGLAFLGRSIIGRWLSRDLEKYKAELKAANDRELERLRAELAERRDFLNTLLSVLSSGYLASHERILTAIEFLWSRVCGLRDLSIKCLPVYTLLRPEQYEDMSISQLKRLLPDMTEGEFFQDQASFLSKDNEKRPFVGESLWRIYRIYSAFVGRLVWKVIAEGSKGKIYEWSKDIDGSHDDHLFRVLQGAFDNIELKTIIGEDPRNAPARIMDALELKMLAEMNELIFGRRLVSMSIEEQQRINSLLRPIGNLEEKALKR